ncbi:MAG: glycosyltransferase [Candidatus Brocadia sp.]|nr:glycosyltransferase [Candidatus Brocadia sp.]
MKILLMVFGDVPVRFKIKSAFFENIVTPNMSGHQLITFGYNKGADIQIKPNEGIEKVLENLPKGWTPDVCIMWQIERYLLPRGIENVPFYTVVCMGDWDYDIQLTKNIIEMTDLVIALSDPEKEGLRAIGANNIDTFYFLGIMREYFNPNPKIIRDRTYDILYTSNALEDIIHLERTNWISRLAALADRYAVCVPEPCLNYENYLRLLSDSKVVLSYHRFGSMSSRALEAGVQGTVVLEPGIEINKYFTPNEDFIPITDNNYIEQIDQYLQNEDTLQRMSSRFYQKTTQTFESRKRFLSFLDFLESKIKKTKFTRGYNSLNEYEKCMRRGELYYYAFFRTNKEKVITHLSEELLTQSFDEFRKSIGIFPNPRAMTALAIVKASALFSLSPEKAQIDNGQEIISLLKTVIASYPAYILAYIHLGCIYYRLSNDSEALSMFYRALELLENYEGVIDVFCLHNRDFDLFNSLIRSSVNVHLASLLSGKAPQSADNVKILYQAMTLYLISLIEKKNNNIYKELEACMKSHKLFPQSGTIACNAAFLLAVVGMKDASLMMYKKAISLLPLRVKLRIEYANLLYLYKMDNELMNELKVIFHITKVITTLNTRIGYLNKTIAGYSRLKSDKRYPFDESKEVMINTWLEMLFASLRKNPTDWNIVKRIIELWNELGRTDKAAEILEEYSCNTLVGNDAADNILSDINNVNREINRKIIAEEKWSSEKLISLENLLLN